MKQKREYSAPTLTVVEFKSERGYAISDMKLAAESSLFSSQGQEKWDESNGNLFDNW